MTYEVTITSLRFIFHVITAYSILTYTGNPHRHRKYVALLASCIAGSSVALAAQIVMFWDEILLTPISPALVIFVGSWCLVTVAGGGNLARPFDVSRDFLLRFFARFGKH